MFSDLMFGHLGGLPYLGKGRDMSQPRRRFLYRSYNLFFAHGILQRKDTHLGECWIFWCWISWCFDFWCCGPIFGSLWPRALPSPDGLACSTSRGFNFWVLKDAVQLKTSRSQELEASG